MRVGAISSTPVYDIDVDTIIDDTTLLYDANTEVAPNNLNDKLHEVLPTETWAKPPESEPIFMQGLSQYQNGIMAGFYKNQVQISEPLIPYAYPKGFTKTTDYDIVGIGVYQQSLVVLTKAYPYIVQGYDPETMIIEKLPYKRACLSKRGIVATQHGIIFPSKEGLCIISRGENLITDKVYRKDQWSKVNSGQFVSSFYDNKYFGFIEGTGNAFVLDLDEPGIYQINLPCNVHDIYLEPEDDALYLLTETAGQYSIQSFDSDLINPLTYTWKSKVFESPNYINFSCGKIFGNHSAANPLRFKLYADGVLKETRNITDEQIFRLQPGYQAREWEIQLEGRTIVESVTIATSIEEIKNV